MTKFWTNDEIFPRRNFSPAKFFLDEIFPDKVYWEPSLIKHYESLHLFLIISALRFLITSLSQENILIYFFSCRRFTRLRNSSDSINAVDVQIYVQVDIIFSRRCNKNVKR